jgi:hypothetical protein
MNAEQPLDAMPDALRREVDRILAAVRPDPNGGDKEDAITYAREVVALRALAASPVPTAGVTVPEYLSALPWTYYPAPVGQRGGDRIEDAFGSIVVENIGHIDGPFIVARANAALSAPTPAAGMTAAELLKVFKPLPENELAALREVDPHTWGEPTPAAPEALDAIEEDVKALLAAPADGLLERLLERALKTDAYWGEDARRDAALDREAATALASAEARAAELEQRLQAAYRVKAQCNDDANEERRLRIRANQRADRWRTNAEAAEARADRLEAIATRATMRAAHWKSEAEQAGRDPAKTAVGALRLYVARRDEINADDAVAGLSQFSRKQVYNALTYLTTTGELSRDGYGHYRRARATGGNGHE